MELSNSFTVESDLATAWATLLDVERVAPCMPGASLDSVEGTHFTGKVKVKLGPVSMTYAGEADFQQVDEATRTVVIEGVGKESRGSGTAKAHVTTSLVAESDTRTRVEVLTDLTITGKAAQFGRGVMQDVAGRIVDQFAANLNALLSAPAEPAPADAAGADAGGAGDAGGMGDVANGQAPPPAPPRPAPVLPQAADSIDLLGTAGAPVLKRVLPVVAVVAVVVVGVVIWAKRRG